VKNKSKEPTNSPSLRKIKDTTIGRDAERKKKRKKERGVELRCEENGQRAHARRESKRRKHRTHRIEERTMGLTRENTERGVELRYSEEMWAGLTR